MGAIIRIVLGIGALVGAWMVRGKATLGEEAEEMSLELMGTAVSPSSVSLAALAFALVGLAMIVMGIITLAKRR